jgi:antirestriction protein ArdC
MAEPVGTRQCSPLRFDERAEERAALTEPASPLPAAQDMKRGHSTKEIWLRAKGEMPSFRISPRAGSTGEQTSWHSATIAMQPPGPSIYQTVTDRILSSLKAGVIPWEKPWKSRRFTGGPFPRNFYTGKPYRGINVLLLWSSEYSSPFWLTFKQAQALKGSVRKGEHGTPIVFYKRLSEHAKKDEDPTGEDERVPFVLCHYTVFNVEQCDGLTLPEISQPAIAPEVDEDELCESIVTGWKSCPALYLNGPAEYRAYYRPSTDSVHMPARSRFVDAPHYYSTLFHELVHSTGHASRLNRTFGDRFGDELYSKEELVAEMGAAFLCAIAGIANEHTDRNTTAYIQNWIAKLEEDNRLIVHAAANAQRAVDCILGSAFEEEKETTENVGDAAVNGIPAAVAINIAPTIYRHAHL